MNFAKSGIGTRIAPHKETSTRRAEKIAVRKSPRAGGGHAAVQIMKSNPYAPVVLLADGDTSVRESLGHAMRAMGFEVVGVADTAAALEVARRRSVDVAVLDWSHPGQQAAEAFQPLTREHPAMPVVIITAHHNPWYPPGISGVDALLDKPFEIETLIQVIRELLDQSLDDHLTRISGETIVPRISAHGQSSAVRESGGSSPHYYR